MDSGVKAGGCACGQVVFKASLPHDRVVLCHCEYCQRRTGSAFGLMVYFAQDHVRFSREHLRSYAYRTDSGNEMQSHFCMKCGTSLFLTGDILKGQIGVAGGCFDDETFWYKLDREVFCRSKAHFVHVDAETSMETSPRYKPLSN